MRQARGGVLVVGGGFAGGYVARLLGKRGATIVSPENFMLYTPMLPEAASGTLEPRHVVVPLRQMCPHAELVLGRVTAIDEERGSRTVETPDAGRSTSATSSSCVALGAVAARCPVPGLAEHGLGFKDLADAIHLRNHVLRELEAADAELDAGAARRAPHASSSSAPATQASRRSPSSPISSRDALRYYPRLRDVPQRWVLVDAAPKILPEIPTPPRRVRRTRADAAAASRSDVATTLESLDGDEARALERRADPDAARSSGRRASSAHPLLGELGLPLDDRGRVRVDAFLRVEGRERRLGARRLRAPSRTSATPGARRPADLPARAPPGAPAREEPARRRRSPYRYRMLGQVATLGRYKGIADVMGLRFRGFPGWFVTRTYHLCQLPLFSRKLRVVADWTTSLFFRRDIAELSMLGAP